MNKMTNISVIVPVFNEELNILLIHARLSEVMRAVGVSYELVFVNDGSKDESLKTLLELRSRYKFVCVIELSRNFGQHQAIACP